MRPIYITIAATLTLVACSEPPPPRSVQEFLDSPIVLEAVLVKCAQNRTETRYDAECVNARHANRIVMAEEEAKRRAAFEEQSLAKRRALRRAQEAAAAAQRRAEEQQRRREEAAYQAQFGEVTDLDAVPADGPEPNAPGALLPAPSEEPLTFTDEPKPLSAPPESVAPDEPAAEPEEPRDLADIREELKRRNDGDD